MNVKEYFLSRVFPNTVLETEKQLIHRLLDDDGGAEDDCTVGDILAEMPVDSPCGLDCKIAIDAALLFINVSVNRAHGADLLSTQAILNVAVGSCCTFIRG